MERERIEPGWYKDIDNDRYHSSAAIGSTSLKSLLETAPSGYLYKQNQPSKQTPAMMLGTMVHEMVLEPDLANEKYIAQPDFGDCRRKSNKEARDAFISQNQDKIAIPEPQYEQGLRMRDSVLNHEMASLFLDQSINESSVYWWYRGDYDDETKYKVMCKVRPDVISVSHSGVLMDLKTTDDASYTGFAKSIVKYSYHLSAAMYLEGVNQCEDLLEETGAFAFTNFVFIAVEKTPPYNVALYELSKEDLRLGRVMYRKAVLAYHKAKEENFPGYAKEVRTIELPSYAKNMHVV